MKRIALAFKDNADLIIVGMLLTLAFAPFDIWPIAVLSPAYFLYRLDQHSMRNAALQAFFFAFGFFGSGVSWVYVSIHTYGFTPPVLAVPFTLIFVAFLAALFFSTAFSLYGRFARGFNPALFIVLWLLSEWLRSWLLTGFPWNYLGYAALDTVYEAYAPILGVYGISLIFLVFACCVVVFYQRVKEKNIRACVILLLLVAGLTTSSFYLQEQRFTQFDTRPAVVGMTQGNIPQDMKWQKAMQQATLDIYQELNSELWGAEFILWPEAAIPMLMHEAVDFLSLMQEQVEQNDAVLITGLPFAEPDESALFGARYYNSLLMLSPEGSQLYHKQKLVPFGEFVPLERWIRGTLPFFDLPMSSFSKGDAEQDVFRAGRLKMAPYICYELLYPDFVWRNVSDANLLITVSNDAWFGESIGPLQHFQMARMRALETGRYLMRATNTGITAIVDDRGKVVSEIPQFERQVLKGEVRLAHGKTPVMIWGSWPVWILSLLIAMFSMLDGRSLMGKKRALSSS